MIYTCTKCDKEFDSVKVKRYMQDPEGDRSGPRMSVCAKCSSKKAGRIVEAAKKKFPSFAVGVKHDTVKEDIVEAAKKAEDTED